MKTSWRYLCKMSRRCLEDFLITYRKSLLKTSWKCLEDLLKTSWRRLEDVWPKNIYWSWSSCLEDVLKTSSEDIWVRWIYSSWSRRLEDVLKMSSEDEDERRLQDVFIKTNVCWEVILKYQVSMLTCPSVHSAYPKIHFRITRTVNPLSELYINRKFQKYISVSICHCHSVFYEISLYCI